MSWGIRPSSKSRPMRSAQTDSRAPPWLPWPKTRWLRCFLPAARSSIMWGAPVSSGSSSPKRLASGTGSNSLRRRANGSSNSPPPLDKDFSSGGGLLDDPLARLLNELEPVPLASRLGLLDPDDTGAPHIMLLLAAGKKHLNQRVFGQGSHGGARESV